jgi:hypothetical protein
MRITACLLLLPALAAAQSFLIRPRREEMNRRGRRWVVRSGNAVLSVHPGIRHFIARGFQ